MLNKGSEKPVKQLNILITEDQYQKLRLISYYKGISIGKIIRAEINKIAAVKVSPNLEEKTKLKVCAKHPTSIWVDGYNRCGGGNKLNQDCEELL